MLFSQKSSDWSGLQLSTGLYPNKINSLRKRKITDTHFDFKIRQKRTRSSIRNLPRSMDQNDYDIERKPEKKKKKPTNYKILQLQLYHYYYYQIYRYILFFKFFISDLSVYLYTMRLHCALSLVIGNCIELYVPFIDLNLGVC